MTDIVERLRDLSNTFSMTTSLDAADEIERIRTSEREGWRYANELEQECRRLDDCWKSAFAQAMANGESSRQLRGLLAEALPAISDHFVNDGLVARIESALCTTDHPAEGAKP